MLNGTKVFFKFGVDDVCESKKTSTGKLCLCFVHVPQASAVKIVDFFRGKGISMDYQNQMFIIHEEGVSRFLRIVQDERLIQIS